VNSNDATTTMNGDKGEASLSTRDRNYPTSTAQLLDCVTSLVSAERGLTRSIENTLPLLHRRPFSSSITGTSSTAPPPILPTPASMSEVNTILSVARMYSSRTSAPAGWKPTLPVFGFATPNPLPHQLRGGALGALQLSMAREERRRKKMAAEDKEREEKAAREEEEKKKKEEEEAASAKRRRDEGEDVSATPRAGNADPKRRELNDRRKSTAHAAEEAAADLAARRREQQQRQAQRHQVQAATMNLSESSSEEDDDDDDSSEED